MAFAPNVIDALTRAGQKHGIDPQILQTIAQIESGGNPNAKNPNSSAGGLFQFIDSTAQQYGLQNKFDPYESADAGARLLRDNANQLRGVLGREPTAGELYLAHQQGGGGAAKLLSNPNARAVDIVGRDAVRLNGGDENMTAQEFANRWIGKADSIAGGGGQNQLTGSQGDDTMEEDAASLAGQILSSIEPDNFNQDRFGPLPGQENLDAAKSAAALADQILGQIDTPEAMGAAEDAQFMQGLQSDFESGTRQGESQPSSLRDVYSRGGMELAGKAAGGLVGGEGVVKTPESAQLVEGVNVPIPGPVRSISDFVGNALLSAAGAGEGAMGYVAGGIGDLLVNSGAMDRSSANRLVRDIMASPEAFAGSPGQLATGAERAAVRGAQRAEQAVPDVPVSTVAQEARVAERAVPETPMQPQPGATQAIPETPSPGAAQAATEIVDADKQIGDLIRKGAGFGVGARRAREELAKLAQANPEAKAAAERLNIDLPVDVLADNRQIKEAIGATRSISGSEASRAWRDDLIKITDRADEAITELAGATDLSTVSDKVLNRLSGTQQQLREQAGKLYNSVDEAVPKSSQFQPDNTVIALNRSIEELGGIEGMTGAEKRLFNMVTNPDQPVTYARMMREKDMIRRALDGDIRENPYGSIDQNTLRRMYDGLSQDQLANVERLGGAELADNLKLANGLWRQQADLGNQVVSAFGRDMNGSIASKLRTAIASGAKGDISGLNRILEYIPKDLQKEAVLSAIRENASATQGGVKGFGFSQFANTYSSIRRNPAVYKKIVQTVGVQGDAVLRDLYEISKRVTEARANVISTGKANQPLIEAMRSEGVLGRIMQTSVGRRAVQAAGTGGGAITGGPAGAMLGDAMTDMIARARPDRMESASKLFRSDDFKSLIEDVATKPTVSPKKIKKVSNSKQFRAWAKENGIDNPENWLDGVIASSVATENGVQ